jgi:fucose 4-O-acetylase-like acetyltransferase
MSAAFITSNTADPVQTGQPELLLKPQIRTGKHPFLRDIRLAQAFAILCVVSAHATIPGHRFTGILEVLDRFIRTVAVPLFICVSGYLYHYSGSGVKPVGVFLRERAYRLLLPYVSLSTLAFLIKGNIGSLAWRSLPFTPAAYLHELFYPWDNVIIFFWYLPTLMLICVISVYLDRLIIRRYSMALFPVLVALAWISTAVGINQAAYRIRFINICGALNYLFYFWIGYTLSKYERPIFALFRSAWLCVPFLLASMAFAIACPNPDHGLALLEASLVTVAMIAMAKQMSRWREWPVLAKIGDNSYQIYLLSWFFQTLPIIVFSRLITQNQYACALASLLLAIGGPTAIAWAARTRLPVVRPLIGLRQ